MCAYFGNHVPDSCGCNVGITFFHFRRIGQGKETEFYINEHVLYAGIRRIQSGKGFTYWSFLVHTQKRGGASKYRKLRRFNAKYVHTHARRIHKIIILNFCCELA